jgi:hypothetical protein
VTAAVHARLATRDLQRARRRRYVADGDWVDSLYKAYVTVIVSAVSLFYLTLAFGTTRVDDATIATVGRDGPALLGILVALLVALGLRSGARGGPLALAAPDVAHLLLAPIPRELVLRAAAWRQLRGVLLAPAVGGAVAGSVACGRLGGDRAEWIVAGALFGVLAALLVWGAALVASGSRLTIGRARVLVVVILAWPVLDVLLSTRTAPTTQLGRIALTPLSWSGWAIIGIALPLLLVGVGIARIGGTSVEAQRRRGDLVRELRYAATLQDLRSVIVLQRELAQELPRSRPWWHVGRGFHADACRRRDWQGYARWPIARVVRVVVLAVVAGVALAGVWRASDAFVIVAGLALFLAGVDTIEGLAQERDHPDRAGMLPVSWGELVLRHVVAPACALAAVASISLTVFVAVMGTEAALETAAIAFVPIAIAAAFAAATSVVAGAPSPTLYLDFPFPEFAIGWLLLRQLIPPLIAMTAFVPVAVAHDAMAEHQPVVSAAFTATLLPLGAVLVTSRWLSSRRSIA